MLGLYLCLFLLPLSRPIVVWPWQQLVQSRQAGTRILFLPAAGLRGRVVGTANRVQVLARQRWTPEPGPAFGSAVGPFGQSRRNLRGQHRNLARILRKRIGPRLRQRGRRLLARIRRRTLP